MSTQTFKIGPPTADDLRGETKKPDSLWVTPYKFNLLQIDSKGIATVNCGENKSFQVDARRLIPSVEMAITLSKKIESTNNGYLFAPSAGDIESAKAFPVLFLIKETGDATFPLQIRKKP